MICNTQANIYFSLDTAVPFISDGSKFYTVGLCYRVYCWQGLMYSHRLHYRKSLRLEQCNSQSSLLPEPQLGMEISSQHIQG